ncbi:MAG: type 1 glutamine amidotransferase domain-containing protein [Cyclobacteriaceae bacterium]
MSKKKKIILGSLAGLLTLILSLVLFGYWFMGLIQKDREFTEGIESTLPTQISYLAEDSVANRGKILAVVTSQSVMGETGKSTGYELSELARAYYVFTANGFTVEVASPKGGKAPIVIDDDDMWQYDHAFMNDTVAQRKVAHTIPLDEVDPGQYAAVYFVGGKGAMFDFPDNAAIQSLVARYYDEGKVIGAVCHGPAALVNVTLSDGSALLEGKMTSSFTNTEELFLIPDAPEVFPFMLQDKLVQQGATFDEGFMYLENVISDGNLVTGQNPWSAWALAEAMIGQMGYTPKPRQKTPEENAVRVLMQYESSGYDAALAELQSTMAEGKPVQRSVIGVHCVIAAMNLQPGKMVNLIRLLSHT